MVDASKRTLSANTAPANLLAVHGVAELASAAPAGATRQLVLSPALMPPPQIPLFREGSLPPDVVKEHYAWAGPPPVCVYAVTGHVLGGGGLLRSEDVLFLPPDCYPGYIPSAMAGGELPGWWGGAIQLVRPIEVLVDEPCACPFHPNLVYGHFLVEILPRLFILRILRDIGIPFRIALQKNLQDWAKQFILLYFEEEDIIWYDFYTEVIRAPAFLVPGMMHDGASHFHPLFSCVGKDLTRRAQIAAAAPDTPQPPARIYLSRTRATTNWHRIANEQQVEDTMQELGFSIVHPQELPIPTQINLYSSAKCLCAEYSSALHNSLFCRRGARVIALNRVNWYQSLLGRVLSQPLAIIPPADGRMRDWRLRHSSTEMVEFAIDCNQLRAQVREFLGD